MRTFVLVLLALVSTSVEVVACVCGGKPTVDEALARSSAIVEGTLVSKRVSLGGWTDWAYPAVDYEFAVTRVWRGEPSEELVLRGHHSNCASYFQGGQTFLIYASRNDDSPGTLTSTICSRTVPIANAADDLARLGAPTASFDGKARTWTRIPAHHLLRTYFVAGIAGYLNFASHLGNDFAGLGALPVSTAALALGVLVVAAVFVRRKPRFAAVLATGGVVLVVAGILLAGQVVLSNPYFSPYVSW